MFYNKSSLLALGAFLAQSTQLVGAFTLIALVDRLPRRAIMVVTHAGMGLAVLALGCYFYLLENVIVACESDFNCQPKDGYFSQAFLDLLSPLPLVSLMLYIVSVAGGKPKQLLNITAYYIHGYVRCWSPPLHHQC